MHPIPQLVLSDIKADIWPILALTDEDKKVDNANNTVKDMDRICDRHYKTLINFGQSPETEYSRLHCQIFPTVVKSNDV